MNHLIQLAVAAATLAGLWGVFAKAGVEGWKAIVPFYNVWVLVELMRKPTWFVVLPFIPFANLYFWWVVSGDLSKAFGKSPGFGVGLFFLPFIFLPMVAFSEDKFALPQ